MKLENLSTQKINLDLARLVNGVFDAVPKNHATGIGKVVFVDTIQEKALASDVREKLPCLYHPRAGAAPAWLEVALAPMLNQDTFLKRRAARVMLKSNIVGALLSLIGQHYHLSFSHGTKRHQYRPLIESYVEKHYGVWRDQNPTLRSRLLKPFHPYLDRFGKWLAESQRKLAKSQARARAAKAKK
jgi:hypothetical protein